MITAKKVYKSIAFALAVLGFASGALRDVRAQGPSPYQQARHQQAQHQYVCRLQTGVTVPVVTDFTLKNIAVARRNARGVRSIVVNPAVLGAFQPATRWFWLAHECAHQQLGHTLGRFTANLESRADCYGIGELIRHNVLSGDDMETIVVEISELTGDGGLYPSGQERAQNIVNCAHARLR